MHVHAKCIFHFHSRYLQTGTVKSQRKCNIMFHEMQHNLAIQFAKIETNIHDIMHHHLEISTCGQ